MDKDVVEAEKVTESVFSSIGSKPGSSLKISTKALRRQSPTEDLGFDLKWR